MPPPGSAYFIGAVAAGHVRRPARLLLAALMLLIAAGSIVMIPVTMKDAVDSFTSAPNGQAVRLDAQPFLLLGVCALVWIISSSLTNYLLEEAIDNRVMAARLALYRRWLARKPGANDARIGIINRITSDSVAFQAGQAPFARDVTKIIVPNRLSSVRAADTIFVFDSGRIVETGTHDALVARRGAYHGLFRDQIDRMDKGLCRMKLVPHCSAAEHRIGS